MTRSTLLLSVCLAGTATMLSGAIELYLQPDLQSEILETVEDGDQRLGSPAPVLDEVAASVGWHFAEFNGTINGYVPDAKIGKDLFPVDNAIIYSGPSSDSPVITVYRTGDNLEIIDTGVWWEVRLTTAFPVYFLVDPLSSPPVITTSTLDDDPLMSQTEPVTQPSGIVIPEKTYPEVPGDVTGQVYQGVLVKAKKSLGLFTPKAPFYLKDPSGGRIAWLDTSRWIGSGTLNDFIGKPVLIHGEREFDASSKEWIIHVRNMRVK